MPKPVSEDRVKQMLEEPLDSIISLRVSVGARAALREISKFYDTTEQDFMRRFIAILTSAFHDVKSQIELGESFDDLLSRTTRLTLAQFMDTPPADLRRMADEFSKAAYGLADLIEGR